MKWDRLLSEKRHSAVSTSFIYDNRSEFEKDYHTIIGSPIFRRLQDKAQAFPLEKNDYVRTRLTHSLEVSSIGKSLGELVYRRLRSQNADEYFQENSSKSFCDILQCAGLIHDIGNPPFGHFGENAIRDWFKRNLAIMDYKENKIQDYLSKQMVLDLCNFEGNAQALRVLSKTPYIGGMNGLNLTYAVLNTIIKYPVPSTDIKRGNDIKYKKMGYNYAETELFNDIVSTTGTENCRHPLTFLLEAADDIAYKTADIEDAMAKEIITPEILYAGVLEYGKNNVEKGDVYYSFVDMLKNDLEYARNKKGFSELTAVQKWAIETQKMLISCAADGFCNNYESIMSGTLRHDIFKDSGEHIINALAEITEKYVYKDKSKIKIELAGTKILQFLLSEFANAAIYYDSYIEDTIINQKIMDIFSNFYKSSYKHYSKGKTEQERLYLRLIMVSDFISGMTDGYAQNLYNELNGLF